MTWWLSGIKVLVTVLGSDRLIRYYSRQWSDATPDNDPTLAVSSRKPVDETLIRSERRPNSISFPRHLFFFPSYFQLASTLLLFIPRFYLGALFFVTSFDYFFFDLFPVRRFSLFVSEGFEMAKKTSSRWLAVACRLAKNQLAIPLSLSPFLSFAHFFLLTFVDFRFILQSPPPMFYLFTFVICTPSLRSKGTTNYYKMNEI